MSGDHQASSFGDPNAQPPTPLQTPTSAVFPSPVFQTPKARQDSFNDSNGWTPRFAEEYSVFNTTPGNLQGPFGDFHAASLASCPPSLGHKRQLSAGGVAAEIATHVNHFSANPNLPLPPVDPARRLPSSPGLIKPQEYSEQHQPVASSQTPQKPRSTKKAKKKAGVEEVEGQTATPPPSAHKGGRKLAISLKKDNMQNDQGYGHPDFATTGAPQQQTMSFASTSDMFDYPMSAPVAPNASFWDPSADMAGMDLDFASFGTGVFGTPISSHRQLGSFDATQMFLDNPSILQNQQQQQVQQQNRQGQDHRQPIRKDRPLAPKQAMPRGGTLTSSASMPLHSYSGSLDDPFGIISPSGVGVDPGLLFSRPQSSDMDASFGVNQAESLSHFSMADVAQTLSTAPMRQDMRQSASTREILPNRGPDRASASSPNKIAGRPGGLQRSFSENRGRRQLPVLAPAIRPTPAQPAATSSNRPPSVRSSGRISPLKSHTRLSSLTSIPEAAPPRTRTSVKFTIDSKGRARAETTMIVEESGAAGPARRRPSHEMPRRERSFESEDEDSSTDDEPIIIPSRNASFALPDPHKPIASGFNTSHRSVSERNLASFTRLSSDAFGQDPESDAETVMNDSQRGGRTADTSGDAASELRRVVESRQKLGIQMPGSAQRSHRFSTGSFPAHTGSPSKGLERGFPTPSTDVGSRAVRCVCNRNGDGEGFMVQCESCEMWLHGLCINIASRRMLPSVYICAFCANTPNMRGGRMRDSNRGSGLATVGASPLAHKSFKSFR
ncbi:hypothetical protein VD0004_g9409 [Verticillium dahliae]|nr:hypothetical protein VD0004_g9409 [Verticillium dahliae]